MVYEIALDLKEMNDLMYCCDVALIHTEKMIEYMGENEKMKGFYTDQYSRIQKILNELYSRHKGA